jgi:hypothetical protein
VRAHNTTSADAVTVVRGTLLNTAEANGQRLYFIHSACEDFTDWPEQFDCADSRITLYLQPDVQYDIVGWSEARDRRQPDRTLTVLRDSWMCCD